MEPRRRTLAAALAIMVCAVLTTGCDEFNSRRKINEGNKLFKEGKFEAAAEQFESSLKDKDIDVAHYNLGITYVKLFVAGLTTPENKGFADKAAMHLAKWLETHPRDNDARKLMTSVWVDSGDFEKALSYWLAENKTDPGNRDVMRQIASINLKAGRYDETIKWILSDAAAAPNPEGKLTSLIQVGNVVYGVLAPKEKVTGAERLRVADVGITTLYQGLAIDPNNIEIQGLMSALYNFRSLAQGASWAAAIDRATSQNHANRQSVLMKEAKAKQAAAPTQPTPAGSGG